MTTRFDDLPASNSEMEYTRIQDNQVELVPTLMIDDAETKMRTEEAVLVELKISVPFCHCVVVRSW
jgi:hypothetical protein